MGQQRDFSYADQLQQRPETPSATAQGVPYPSGPDYSLQETHLAQQQQELQHRVTNLLESCDALPANLLATYLPRVRRMQDGLQLCLRSGILNMEGVQHLLVTVSQLTDQVQDATISAAHAAKSKASVGASQLIHTTSRGLSKLEVRVRTDTRSDTEALQAFGESRVSPEKKAPVYSPLRSLAVEIPGEEPADLRAPRSSAGSQCLSGFLVGSSDAPKSNGEARTHRGESIDLDRGEDADGDHSPTVSCTPLETHPLYDDGEENEDDYHNEDDEEDDEDREEDIWRERRGDEEYDDEVMRDADSIPSARRSVEEKLIEAAAAAETSCANAGNRPSGKRPSYWLDELVIVGECAVAGELRVVRASGSPLPLNVAIFWQTVRSVRGSDGEEKTEALHIPDETDVSYTTKPEDVGACLRVVAGEKLGPYSLGKMRFSQLSLAIEGRPSIVPLTLSVENLNKLEDGTPQASPTEAHPENRTGEPLPHRRTNSHRGSIGSGVSHSSFSGPRNSFTSDADLLSEGVDQDHHKRHRRKAISTFAGKREEKPLERSHEHSHLAQVTEKTPEQQVLIAEAAKKHFLFTQLSNDEMAMIIRVMFRVDLEKGELIVRQGDQADNFYIIEKGSTEVFITTHNGTKEVGTMCAGDTFGEMALMYSSVRAASVKATSFLTCWALDRKHFFQVLEGLHDSTTQFLRSVKLLAPLTDDEISKLAESSKVILFKNETKLIEQGDFHDKDIYIIKEGLVDVMRNGIKLQGVHLYPGKMIGVDSLLTHQARSASCVANGEVRALRISEAAFLPILPKVQMVLLEDTLKLESLRKALDCETLNADDILDTLDAFETKTFSKGDILCTAGVEAESFMVIAAGTLSEMTLNRHGPGFVMAGHLTLRMFFGHEMLLKKRPFENTIIVQSEKASILVLKAHKFEEARGKADIKKRVAMLEKVGAFKALQAHELKDLAEALESQVFQSADVITQVGDHGDQFFMIESGTAKILMGSHQETYIGKGNFFGEVSFLYKNMKRNATVMAVTELHTLTLRRSDFVSRVSNFAQYLTTLEEAAKNEQLTLNDLTVIKTLGLGQFGRVKLVRNNRTGQHHALKCMKKADIGRQGQVQHVRDENVVMKSLEHPFIIKLVATFKDYTTVYMLMDLCLGGELFSLLNDAPNGFFSNDMARFYAAQVIEALDHIHSQKCCYRDLKPENLLVDIDGYLKLVDFGFCKKLTSGQTFTLCGTADYLAPEIIMHKGHGQGADLWALGVLIYEMLCGHTPFQPKNTEDPNYTYKSILEDPVYFPSHLSESAKDLVSRLLVRDVRHRLGSVKGIREVKTHAWFNGLDWNKLIHKTLKPPYVPQIKSPTDSSHFEEVEEEVETDDLPIDPRVSFLLDEVF